MVLSDVDIRKCVSTGEIVISPFDERRLKPASYTFIKNIGPNPIRIRPGLKVVKAAFMPLKTAASSGYSGVYVGQADPRTRR